MVGVSRRVVRWCGFVALCVWLVVGSGATPVFALGDLRYQSNAVYTVDPAGVVHVALDLTLTNTKSDSGLTYYYYDKVWFSITANAANVRAERNGQKLAISVESQSRFYSKATVQLSPRLRSRQTQVVHVTYDIPPSGARVPGVNRINPAYMTFIAFAYGDPGLTTVSVRVPENFEVDVTWEEMDATFEPGVEVYTASDIAVPSEWAASISASDEDALKVDQLKVAGRDISVRSWPDDPQWGDFVKAQLSKGLPALVKLIGSPLPTTRRLQITETATPYIYGYAGWYKLSDNTIEIGDALDPLVIFHEVSHAWFNRDELDERWLSEGLAEDFGTRAVKSSGGTLAQPTKPDRKSPSKVTLNDWSDPNFDGEDSDKLEAYAYNASFYVLRAVSNEIGPKKLVAVVQSVLQDRSAYSAHGVADGNASVFDWRNMLDAFELIGGSKKAAALFRDHVVSAIQQDSLTARVKALRSYRGLETAGAGWAAPKIVRDRMVSWSFSAVKPSIASGNKILQQRDAVSQQLKKLKVSLPATFQKSYETAGSSDLDDVAKALQAYGRAVDAVVAAQRGHASDRSLWQSIGLIGADTAQLINDAVSALERNDPDLARKYSQQSVAQIDDAARIGTWRAVKAGSVALLTLLVLWCGHLVLNRRRKAKAAALEDDVPELVNSAASDD